jgi:hypothetical protein
VTPSPNAHPASRKRGLVGRDSNQPWGSALVIKVRGAAAVAAPSLPAGAALTRRVNNTGSRARYVPSRVRETCGSCDAATSANACAIRAAPVRGDWAYEVKWDGFRAIVSTESELKVCAGRGWDMSDLLPELASFPTFGTFDGELAASTRRARPISRWSASGC